MGFEIVVRDNSLRIISAKNAAVARGLKRVGMTAEKYAVDNVNKRVYDTPEAESGYKRTGNLRLGIGHEMVGKDSVAVGDNVKYAMYVELGTRHMKPRPFIEPAAMDHLKEYEAIIVQELIKAL